MHSGRARPVAASHRCFFETRLVGNPRIAPVHEPREPKLKPPGREPGTTVGALPCDMRGDIPQAEAEALSARDGGVQDGRPRGLG